MLAIYIACRATVICATLLHHLIQCSYHVECVNGGLIMAMIVSSHSTVNNPITQQSTIQQSFIRTSGYHYSSWFVGREINWCIKKNIVLQYLWNQHYHKFAPKNEENNYGKKHICLPLVSVKKLLYKSVHNKQLVTYIL